MRSLVLQIAVLAGLATGLLASADVSCSGTNAWTEPPAGAIVVDASGSHSGSYTKLSEAVKNLPNTIDTHTIFLFPGVYHEQVTISKLAGPLVLQGYTCNTASYAANEVTITQSKAQRDVPSEIRSERNTLTSTLLLRSNNVKVYNLNVANTAGQIGKNGQAVATTVESSNNGFYGCNFTGYQDTLYANNGRELFTRSYISGAVDFVFGQKAMAWFESCDIETVGEGWTTASGRSSSSDPSWYVFNNARVFGSSGDGITYLGRPWRPYARVVWQNSELRGVVNPRGWSPWGATSSTDKVYFKEFKNSGPGATTDQRVAFSGQLTKPVDITEVLGENYKAEWWVDTNFLQR